MTAVGCVDHKWGPPASKKQLMRPQATFAAWMQAAPTIRMPRTFFRIRLPIVPVRRRMAEDEAK